MTTNHKLKEDKKVNQDKLNKTEVFGCTYFQSKFENKYPPQMLGEKTGKRPIKVSRKLYCKILIEYFTIYFERLFFIEQPSYFLYTGLLSKVKYRPRIIINKGIKKLVSTSIGLMWYQRPSELFFLCCRLLKQKGSTNRLPKMENLYKKNFDIDLIVNFEEAIEINNKNNNNFIS